MTFPIGSVEFSGRFYKEKFGRLWMLAVHQQLDSGFFQTKEHALNSQTAGLYSILGEIHEKSRYNDRFEFLLEYSSGKHNIWRQSVFPLYELKNSSTENKNVTGYEEIDVEMHGANWGGLRKSSSAYTLLDGSRYSSNWHYSVGTLNNSYGCLVSDNCQSETVLWIRASGYPNMLFRKCSQRFNIFGSFINLLTLFTLNT